MESFLTISIIILLVIVALAYNELSDRESAALKLKEKIGELENKIKLLSKDFKDEQSKANAFIKSAEEHKNEISCLNVELSKLRPNFNEYGRPPKSQAVNLKIIPDSKLDVSKAVGDEKLCIKCEEPIEVARLYVLPNTNTCASCAGIQRNKGAKHIPSADVDLLIKSGPRKIMKKNTDLKPHFCPYCSNKLTIKPREDGKYFVSCDAKEGCGWKDVCRWHEGQLKAKL